jgi:uncharacterized membrane protein
MGKSGTFGTTGPRKPISDKELARRNRVRAARLREAQRFPWRSVVLGVVGVLLVLFLFGASLLTLFLVLVITATMTGSKRGRSGFPF